MYAPPDPVSNHQTQMIMNMVVSIFLLIGVLIVLQYFNFIYLNDIPVFGGWAMDIYEQVFGTPKVLILHGNDSVGDWKELRDQLSSEMSINAGMYFNYEDIDIREYDAGMESKLENYGLVIVEDALEIDKGKLINLDNFVKNGGNLVWVGDAGTIGVVEYEDTPIAIQYGWERSVVCVNPETKTECDCSTVAKNSTCKYLNEQAERTKVDFEARLGAAFVEDVNLTNPQIKIVDTDHWAMSGINQLFGINSTKAAKVKNGYETELVANVLQGDDTYPGVFVQEGPGRTGTVLYFAYPPEDTLEVLLPLIGRMRY